jgi:LPXTG-motif cell wall-anchored protein
MKRVAAGFVLGAAAVFLSIVMVAGYAVSATGKPPTVHHPACPAGWTQVVDQPPNSGLSVTAAYSGTLWIKVSNQHFEVPVVSAGDVITPESVSSWPTNKRGKYQEVSHADYCIPPVTETTVPETTVPETTVPETTSPPTTEYPPTDDCLQHIIDGPTLAEGDYIFVDSRDQATGTTRWSIMYCAPIPDPPDTTVPEDCTTGVTNELGGCEPQGTPGLPIPTAPPEDSVASPVSDLPETGSDTLGVLLAAAAMVAVGGGAFALSRRS